jgi:hypothetical protein
LVAERGLMGCWLTYGSYEAVASTGFS